MKNTKLLALLAFAMLLIHCKKTENTESDSRPLTEVTSILKATDDKFIEYNTLSPGEPKKAIEQTKIWLQTQPTVSSVETVDSVYINITLKSGLETSFFLNEIGIDGYSVFRGGGNSNSGNILAIARKNAKNDIKNKNVLIYAPAYSDFYKAGEMQQIVNILNKSGLVTTTLMKDKECSWETIANFKDYGLVIIDTHGEPDNFLAGNEIDTAEGNNEEILKLNIAKAAGVNAYAKIQANELIMCEGYKYVRVKNELIQYSCYNIRVTSKYINGLPKMPGTVIFGNMCHSGWSEPLNNGKTPIGTAFINTETISYYCYIRDNKRSYGVEDGFSKKMEESLVRSLVIDGDSTGIAHLDPEGKPYFDPFIATKTGADGQKVYLYLKQFGAVDYNYYNACVDVFTDNRDGIIYKAVCIGKQNWMAENLRYNAPGSVFYNDDPANGPIYGKLYDWSTVMNGAAPSTANPSGVQGICPKGWHVPSQSEWLQLTDFLGGSAVAGKALKSTSGWDATGGSNTSGFTAIGAGHWDSSLLTYANLGKSTLYWTSEEFDPEWRAYYSLLWSDQDKAELARSYKKTGGSCRCLKD